MISKSKNTTNNIIQFIGLILMLVVFPAGSWFYLQTGLNYQREARAELRNYGTLPDFQLSSQDGKSFSAKDLKGKISVAAFVPDNNLDQFDISANMVKMNKQFQKRNEIQFLLHLLSDETLNPEQLKSIAQHLQTEDAAQCKILSGNPDDLKNLLQQNYKWPVKKNMNDLAAEWQFEQNFPADKSSQYPFFVLLDTLGTIKNYYDARNNDAIKRLVEHVAIVMPKEKEEKAYLNRETEK